MSKLEESIGFYRKMSDLQEKLRRSEEERLQLEDKFALLMRACRDEEEARLNNLRERYEAFLEEEKHRKERNDRILQTLDRIESRAAILTAKSERLKLLRKHYEVYLVRMYPGWKYTNNRLVETLLPIHSKLNSEAERNLSYTNIVTGATNYPLTHAVNQASHPYLSVSHSTQPHPVVSEPLSSAIHPYSVPSSIQSHPVVNQPLSSTSHIYPTVSHPIPSSTQPHQSLLSASHPYPSVSHPIPSSTQPHQPLLSVGHPYPSISHTIPSSTQPHQPLPSAGHPYPSVSHPIPSSTQPHQPLPSAGHPYPSVSHPIPSSTQPHQPLPLAGHPYPSVSHPIPSSIQPHQPLSSAGHPYSSVSHTIPFSTQPHQLLPSASHPYLTVNYPPSSASPGITPIVRQTFPRVHTTTPSSVAPTTQKLTPVSVVDQSYLIPGVSPQFAISTTLPLSEVRTTVEPAPTIDVMSPINTEVQPSINKNHSVQHKQEERLFFNQDNASPEVKKIDQIDGYLGRAAEMLKISGIKGNDDKSFFQNLSEIMPQSLKDDKRLGNSIDMELEQNTSGDILNVTLSDDGILQDEPIKTLVSPTQTTNEDKHIKFTDDVQFEIEKEAGPQQCGSMTLLKTDIPESEEQKKLTDAHVIEVLDVNKTGEVGKTQDEASVSATETEGQYVEAEQQEWDENAAQYYQHDGQYYQYGDEIYQQEYEQGDYDQQEYAEGEYDQQYAEYQYNQQYAQYGQEYTEEDDGQFAYYQNYEAEPQENKLEDSKKEAEESNEQGEVQQTDNSHEAMVKVQQADTGGEAMVKVQQADNGGEAMVKVQQADDGAGIDGEAMVKVQQADNGGEVMVKVQQADNIDEAMVKVQQADNGGEAMVKVQQADNGGEMMVKVQQADDGAGIDGKVMVKVQQADNAGEAMVKVKQANNGAGVDSASSREDVKPGGALPDFSSDVTDPSLCSEKVEQYRQLLGVPAVREPETSDTDELEAQLAALVDTKHDGDKQPAYPVVSDWKTSEPVVKPVVEDMATSVENKPGLHVDVKPVVAHRPVSKKLPDLHKVLESDSESLQLDATVSNAESDDFDFSSDK